MKFKAIAVMTAATALSLGLAVPALAAPNSAKAAPQVTGSRLASALLPSSAFGSGFTTLNRHNSGSSLHSTQVLVRPSNVSCVNFATYTYLIGYGNTAGALDSFLNSNPDFTTYPDVITGADQRVIQFASAGAAQTFYNRAYARYKQCSAFN